MNTVLESALSQYGIKEIPGRQHNPEVLKYFRQSGFEYINDDETPWCSAFVIWNLKMCQYEHSEKLNARSHLSVGKAIPLEEARQGDVVVLWRNDPIGWQGHVAFYINEENGYVYLLGGNQGNMVQISKYPKERVLGVRRMQDLSCIMENYIENSEPYSESSNIQV